ncbi:MAG: 2-oxo acid dehydrogenase subunit E2, partial [Desulfosarcina sp.]
QAADRKSDPAGQESSDKTPETPDVDEKTEGGPASESPQSEKEKRPSNGAEKTPDRPLVAAAPSIRRLARELGVDIRDVSGSGPGGRIREADIKATVKASLGSVAGSGDAQAPELPDFSRWGEVETEAMETVRRLTARGTAASWTTVPHVTQFDEADISGMTAFIDKKAQQAEKAGAKLTLTAILTRVCAAALNRFPRFNASIDMANQRIVLKRYVHIGMAVDTPRGLLVPVIRDADRKSLIELAKVIGDLAQRARDKKIKPDELEGGTFTISNQGGIGGVGFTPIVLWPQVAILGVSRSAIKPVYVEERFEPRTILPLALSYDHRMIDGADAARFLRWICDALEQPMTLFLD